MYFSACISISFSYLSGAGRYDDDDDDDDDDDKLDNDITDVSCRLQKPFDLWEQLWSVFLYPVMQL